MVVPTITERKHYRLIPGEPSEPTSTVVLTSKDSYFVDVRLFRDKIEKGRTHETDTAAWIEWAFAGKSYTKPTESEGGTTTSSHSVWEHWIDSKSDNPGPDEGDMWTQENGDVLERGIQRDPVTGEETEYEELWHDLEVIPLGKKQNRSSLVLKAEDPEKNLRGLAVKVGGWCQAILKVDGALTVERWERKPIDSTEDQAVTEGAYCDKRTNNDWNRTFKSGSATLPCEYICSNTSGKLGLNTTFGCWHDEAMQSATNWRVIEEYYW